MATNGLHVSWQALCRLGCCEEAAAQAVEIGLWKGQCWLTPRTAYRSTHNAFSRKQSGTSWFFATGPVDAPSSDNWQLTHRDGRIGPMPYALCFTQETNAERGFPDGKGGLGRQRLLGAWLGSPGPGTPDARGSQQTGTLSLQVPSA